ncbi:MAG TPA: tetratricopeptide repeat protein [Candidatus Acidoferrales bacterium]|nr:tetratricopeptide repeat protein [Candidatus Acidoferrales bacterium]
MRLFSKALTCCALCLLWGALQLTYPQTVGVTRKHVPADPAAAALNRLIDDAQEAVNRQDFDAAAKDYQDYLAQKPDDAAVHYDLGYVYTALHRPADAKSQYERAISLDSKMAPAYLNLGLTLMGTDAAAAADALNHAVALMPGQARPVLLLGEALERSGKLAPAIEQYQAAEKLDAKDPETRVTLGRALLSANRPNDAEAEYRAALELQPAPAALAEAHRGLALALIAEKKPEEGAREMDVYLQAAPGDKDARVERASALVDLGKEDDALAELDRATGGVPEGLRALKLRSEIYWDKKRYDDALAVLVNAAAIAPRDPDISARLGEVYLKKKDFADAVRWLGAAYSMNSQANDLLADLMDAEYESKNYSAALQLLDVLSKRQELPLGSWYLRAACYDKLGQPAEALDAYQRFLQLNKDENSDMYFVSTARVRVLTRELQDKKKR